MTLTIKDAKPALLAVAIAAGWLIQCGRAQAAELASAYVAGGCFWCVEADFEKVEGVAEVVSGYSGGDVPNPSYKQVVRGGTGHYEAVEIRYDPDVVSYDRLLGLFFRSVDPTDAGGQFCDRGASYRTAIFAQDGAERQAAEAAKADAEAALGQKVVTPVLDFDAFYEAEDYHQDYYRSDERLAVTSVGIAVPKKVAYQRYREGCGRDQRIRQLWGDAAPFAS